MTIGRTAQMYRYNAVHSATVAGWLLALLVMTAISVGVFDVDRVTSLGLGNFVLYRGPSSVGNCTSRYAVDIL